ncbi:MAG: NAD-dependent epimerase/dehydratase family protein [Candidatus Obscuribacterales bacterium]|nr:NAD-dependent epimerase/dehydratase family protein [Candidatus Obscuribacterales bacterium]
MKVLILGGTIFLGRHIVTAALHAGHEVTTFNRGSKSLEEQNRVEKLIADRRDDLSVLTGKKWDAVIDTCGYEPQEVEKSAAALKNSVDNYTFISSISVYKGFPVKGMDETARVKSIEDGDEAEYGSLKVGCEREVEKAFGDKALIIRPGLIVGPYDPTDRFTYWPTRVSKGGRVAAPGDPEKNIQFIDVRDLANWTVKLVETRSKGVFNATGPKEPLTMHQFLNECNAAVGNIAQFVWLRDEQILAAGVAPWIDMPLWIPESDEEHRYFQHMDCTKAQKTGLTYSPLAATIRDTLKWDMKRDREKERKAGLKPEKEKVLLDLFGQ